MRGDGVQRRYGAPSPQRGEGWGEGAPTSSDKACPLTQPSPRWGEGFCGSLRPVEAEEEFVADRFEDGFGVLKHVVVPEADHPVAEAFDCAGASGVGGLAMLAAVDLDHQARGAAREVGNVRADRELEDEFGAFDLAGAEALPEAVLRVGSRAAEFARYRREAFFCQRRSPSPQPSPRRGEGAWLRPSLALSPPGRGLGEGARPLQSSGTHA